MPFLSLGHSASMIEFIDDIPFNLRNFKYPFLMMVAEKEFVVDNEGARHFYKYAASDVK